jgi:hypothetical protein
VHLPGALLTAVIRLANYSRQVQSIRRSLTYIVHIVQDLKASMPQSVVERTRRVHQRAIEGLAQRVCIPDPNGGKACFTDDLLGAVLTNTRLCRELRIDVREATAKMRVLEGLAINFVFDMGLEARLVRPN